MTEKTRDSKKWAEEKWAGRNRHKGRHGKRLQERERETEKERKSNQGTDTSDRDKTKRDQIGTEQVTIKREV